MRETERERGGGGGGLEEKNRFDVDQFISDQDNMNVCMHVS